MQLVVWKTVVTRSCYWKVKLGTSVNSIAIAKLLRCRTGVLAKFLKAESFFNLYKPIPNIQLSAILPVYCLPCPIHRLPSFDWEKQAACGSNRGWEQIQLNYVTRHWVSLWGTYMISSSSYSSEWDISRSDGYGIMQPAPNLWEDVKWKDVLL